MLFYRTLASSGCSNWLITVLSRYIYHTYIITLDCHQNNPAIKPQHSRFIISNRSSLQKSGWSNVSQEGPVLPRLKLSARNNHLHKEKEQAEYYKEREQLKQQGTELYAVQMDEIFQPNDA